MPTGKVKWFNMLRGYGFIEPDSGGEDVFVHISSVQRSGLSPLIEGQHVDYDLGTNEGKTLAVNLKVVEEAA